MSHAYWGVADGTPHTEIDQLKAAVAKAVELGLVLGIDSEKPP